MNQKINKQPSAFSHVSRPRVITVDKNPAYPAAIKELKEEKQVPKDIQIRQIKYLNNIVNRIIGSLISDFAIC